MMIDTKLKIRNISKNLSSNEAASRIIVQYQSGLSGQRVFYNDMCERQSGKKIIRNQRFERVACLVQKLKVQRFKFEIVFSTNLTIWQQMLESTSQQANKPRKFINGNLMQFIHLVVKIIGVNFPCVGFRDNSRQCNSRCYSQSVFKIYSYP